jgi:hypothetical protein
MAALRRPVLVVVGEQVPHGGERVTRPTDHVEQHRVTHGELRLQRLGLGSDQPVKGGPAPGHHPLRRLLRAW